VHALAFAAYEVLHALSKKRDPNRRSLLFDSDRVKDEYRSEFNKHVKKYAHFFKHADRDGDSVMEFDAGINEWFILYATTARQLCGEPHSQEESDFLWWFHINPLICLRKRGAKCLLTACPSRLFMTFGKCPSANILKLSATREPSRKAGRPLRVADTFCRCTTRRLEGATVVYTNSTAFRIVVSDTSQYRAVPIFRIVVSDTSQYSAVVPMFLCPINI
jgi:hypothetical protein